MAEIKKLIRLSRLEFFKVHLSLINCLLPRKMTPKEIEVMANFMSLEGDISLHRFGPSARKMIRERMEISMGGLSNYMTSLLEKGFLMRNGDLIVILPILFPQDNEQEYRFKLIMQP
jgi:DNA-binding MarR family transcriptional regulator